MCGRLAPPADPSSGRPVAVRGRALRSSGAPLGDCSARDFAAAFDLAFDQIDRQKGSHNFVSLVDLRRTMEGWPRAEFDRNLRDLRIAGRLELAGAESPGGLLPEERQAGIEEAGSLLLYVSRRRS